MIKNGKKLFKYNKEWFEYNFIDEDYLQEQIAEYQKGEDSDIEHYKWGAYRYILYYEDFASDQRKIEFLRLIENDPNEHLWKGAISELIDRGIFDKTWESLMPNSRVFKWPLLNKKLERINGLQKKEKS